MIFIIIYLFVSQVQIILSEKQMSIAWLIFQTQ